TTPCAGTSMAVKLRTAVPLSVCVHKSYEKEMLSNAARCQLVERAYSDGVLDASADPWRFGEVEEHVSRLAQGVDLEYFNIQISNTNMEGRTSMITVPFSLGPLQY